MTERRTYSQLIVRYSASVPAHEYSQAIVLIIIFCNFSQQKLQADDFKIPPHRQSVTVYAVVGVLLSSLSNLVH